MGVHPAVGTVPHSRRGDFTVSSFANAHEYLNAIIRRVALSESVPLIDLAAAGEWGKADVYDGLHFTDAGSRRVAGIIADAMAPWLRRSLASRQ